MLEPSMFMVKSCSLPEITEIKTGRLPSGEGEGSRFCACVIWIGMDNGTSEAKAAQIRNEVKQQRQSVKACLSTRIDLTRARRATSSRKAHRAKGNVVRRSAMRSI